VEQYTISTRHFKKNFVVNPETTCLSSTDVRCNWKILDKVIQGYLEESICTTLHFWTHTHTASLAHTYTLPHASLFLKNCLIGQKVWPADFFCFCLIFLQVKLVLATFFHVLLPCFLKKLLTTKKKFINAPLLQDFGQSTFKTFKTLW